MRFVSLSPRSPLPKGNELGTLLIIPQHAQRFIIFGLRCWISPYGWRPPLLLHPSPPSSLLALRRPFLFLLRAVSIASSLLPGSRTSVQGDSIKSERTFTIFVPRPKYYLEGVFRRILIKKTIIIYFLIKIKSNEVVK